MSRSRLVEVDGEVNNDAGRGTPDSSSTCWKGPLYHGTTSTKYMKRVNDDVGRDSPDSVPTRNGGFICHGAVSTRFSGRVNDDVDRVSWL